MSIDTAKSFGYIVKSISVSSLELKPTPSSEYSSKNCPITYVSKYGKLTISYEVLRTVFAVSPFLEMINLNCLRFDKNLILSF